MCGSQQPLNGADSRNVEALLERHLTEPDPAIRHDDLEDLVNGPCRACGLTVADLPRPDIEVYGTEEHEAWLIEMERTGNYQ